MKQLELFKNVKGKEIQLRERPATTLIPNSAYGKVTSRMKPRGGSPWAANESEGIEPSNNQRSGLGIYLVPLTPFNSVILVTQ